MGGTGCARTFSAPPPPTHTHTRSLRSPCGWSPRASLWPGPFSRGPAKEGLSHFRVHNFGFTFPAKAPAGLSARPRGPCAGLCSGNNQKGHREPRRREAFTSRALGGAHGADSRGSVLLARGAACFRPRSLSVRLLPGALKGPVVSRPSETRPFPSDSRRGGKGWRVALERAKGTFAGLKSSLSYWSPTLGLRSRSHSPESGTSLRPPDPSSSALTAAHVLFPVCPSPPGLCRALIWGPGVLSLKSRRRSSRFYS